MSREVIMKCPDCGAIVKGKYGFLMNKEFVCANCARKINPKSDSYETVTCKHCGNTVIHDTRVGADQSCPACGYSLSEYNISDIELPCPSCHMNQRIKYNETVHTCPICNYIFDVNQLKATQAVAASGSASVITVPANNTDVIWKHPMTTFPFASHVVIPEGYSALILRDGICSAPSEAGKYVLSDTIRTMTEQLEYAMLEKNAQVSVQIFFVRKNIDKQVKWTGVKQPVSYADGRFAGTLGFGGSVAVSICDAKRFVEFVGYDTVTADQLLVTEPGRASKLYEKVRAICFESMELVLKSAVYSNGFTFDALEQNQSFFKQQGQGEIDKRLAELGLKTSLFSLDFISFEEAEERKQEKAQTKAQIETAEQIGRHIETLFDWESPVVPIHMKNDITMSADVKFGGTIKFRISDKEQFGQISQIQYWMKQGVNESEIKKYVTDLVKQAAGEVLGDILQQMINDIDANIRDLTIYHQYMRNNTESALSVFFEKYGLTVEMFTMQEKERKESPALMTLARAQEHKSVQNIQTDVYAFDQQQRVDRSAIDNKTKVDLDTQAVDTETAMTRNNQGRAQNTIDNMYIQNNVTNAKDEIERQQKLKHEAWAREDAQSQGAWQQSQKLQGYQYQSELSQAAHDAKLQDIRQEKDEKQELHYTNQQEIENRASELRAKWEADKNLKMEELANAIRMNDMKWDAQKKMTREQQALQNELDQASTENERVINDILRKIAESDLELSEKKAAYNRMLKNQAAEDDVRNMVNKANAEMNLDYNSGHLQNILTKEENDLVAEMDKRAAERAEAAKNADFVRDMQTKERENEYQLALLKMEYERDKYKAEMEQLLRAKDKELEELREKLAYNAHLSDNDVQKTAINANADASVKTAEYAYKAAHENQVYATQEQRYQDNLNLEQKYMNRLDDLLSQMLAIDTAMKKYSYKNEKEAIRASANVQMVQAASNAEASVAQAAMTQNSNVQAGGDTHNRITEMEEMMRKMKNNIKSLKASIANMKSQPVQTNGNYTQGYSGYAGGYTSPYAGNPQGNLTPQYQGVQPGTVRCKHCGAVVSAGNTYCPNCNAFL